MLKSRIKSLYLKHNIVKLLHFNKYINKNPWAISLICETSTLTYTFKCFHPNIFSVREKKESITPNINCPGYIRMLLKGQLTCVTDFG